MKKIGAFVACTLIVGATIAVTGAVPWVPIARADGNDRQGWDEGSQSGSKGDSSPYMIAAYKFAVDDDGKVLVDTEYRAINPTPRTLTLEYSFFDEKGHFCGCDVDQMAPNGTTVYTMKQELDAGFFRNILPSTTWCDITDTSGTIKSIVFKPTQHDKVRLDGATVVGFQTHVFKDVEEPDDTPIGLLMGKKMTEAGQRNVAITRTTLDEIHQLHQTCAQFQSELPPPPM